MAQLKFCAHLGVLENRSGLPLALTANVQLHELLLASHALRCHVEREQLYVYAVLNLLSHAALMQTF
jgi:hypothetical protein